MPQINPNPPVVLLVEDEPLVRLCIAAQLQDDGFSVIEAADAQEALDAFKADDRVTTVFTDINMPGPFDGLSLAHQLVKLRPQVRLILTSGRREPATKEMPAGVHFLPKPYDYRRLADFIKAA